MQSVKNFEKYIFYFLTVVLACYILIEIVELVYIFVKSIFEKGEDGRLLLSKGQVHEILPVFFTILIALELIDTFDVYVKSHTIKVLNILLIGLIAIGRKLLSLDFAHADGLSNIGLASLILSISVGYFLIKKVSVEGDGISSH